MPAQLDKLHDTAPEFCTLPFAARLFGIGQHRFRRLVKSGAFPTYEIGSTRSMVCIREVREYMLSQRVPFPPMEEKAER